MNLMESILVVIGILVVVVPAAIIFERKAQKDADKEIDEALERAAEDCCCHECCGCHCCVEEECGCCGKPLSSCQCNCHCGHKH